MKKNKTERPPPQGNWVDRVRQLLSVPKAEIDRRDTAWKQQKQEKRARQRARATIVLVGLACSALDGCSLTTHTVGCDLLLPVCIYQNNEGARAIYMPMIAILLWPVALTVGVIVDASGSRRSPDVVAQQAATEAVADAIIVTPSDLNRPYTVLGSVDYPGKGVTRISLTGSPPTCGPDNARQKAVEEYGSRVNAIIGFTQWRDGSTAHCGGTAVAFSDTPH